ncbi:PREDICTED: protein PLASTID MOVEMENT IMPAIRED 1 [Nicotiana attenuata]|uniref:Protein plastid movement impaired 1 n=1 Tax=Nicotiana attenuata TaxID=49451 RepID=A0A314KR37_NICAT|nr:PREDICTED: protein PLASTID MOVEMENT IMPAIRED 1 [Nicotiana attenuata]XP_019226816.1 PREDICTED: protein PLASTID MOVEMENT IMPAIRED 1 [Nicotiana attenuata]XP_019226817.1 PREDICTED: protein PLASTID MOVEMENT IMPAIRED 1 [Nicotiana attenuata]OIT31808.1 protein plastid movement impaired 1 [Nicotiana attenuata]
MADYITNTRRNSNTQLLQELEALSETLYQPNTSSTSTTRRTASLVLPRTSVPPIAIADDPITSAKNDDSVINPKPRSRRMSLSPWRSRPKLDIESEDNTIQQSSSTKSLKKFDSKAESNSEKKGLWNWKPIRALAHIGKQKLSCLFSVEIVTVQGLPASMNGLRLSVCVRKKETKEGAVQTMPSRVSQGAADFEETLFIRCHVYYTPATTTGSSGSRFKFEPRPFLIYVFAVDAEELDFGKNLVDLSEMIQESIEKSFEGNRIRQWDTSYPLLGKAKGGELVLKLGFQIMEKDGGIGIYSQAEGQKTGKNANYSSSSSSSFARKQSKTSFSVPSPRMTSLSSSNWTPSQTGTTPNLQGIDELNLDAEPEKEPESKAEDLDLPEFDVVDKGVEIQDKDEAKKEVEVKEEEEEAEEEEEEEQSEGNSDKRSVSSHEVVKEIVHDQHHLTRLSELDSIAQQIKALESMFKNENQVKTEDDDSESQRLDADEENVTREFLQMLEDSGGANQFKTDQQETPTLKLQGGDENSKKRESVIFIPDLGKGLGCVVQTRNGGFLAAMNPLNTVVSRKDTPKLAMQISKPFVFPSILSSMNGFEIFQRMAAIGMEEFTSKILSMMPMEELVGKTAEQIAFEGIASAIIQGRNKEVGASSTAARTVAAVKSMATAMNTSRNERISTGIWNISDEPLTVDEILAFTLQKMEAMTIEALKIQADIAEEEAPFDVSPHLANKKDDHGHSLESAVPLEDWEKDDKNDNVVISVVLQLRDPLRQFEAVGGPMIALIQAVHIDEKTNDIDEEKKFKIACLAIGGLRVGSGEKKNAWDTEKQRLTAMQWLVAYGLGKMGKKVKKGSAVKGQHLLWSISSRVMADMWLKSIRNPDIKFIM